MTIACRVNCSCSQPFRLTRLNSPVGEVIDRFTVYLRESWDYSSGATEFGFRAIFRLISFKVLEWAVKKQNLNHIGTL